MATSRTWFVPAARSVSDSLLFFGMRTALVTGVGRDGQVGQAVARRLSADGLALIVVDRDATVATERAAEIENAGGRALALAADLSDERAVDHLFEEIARVATSLAAVVHLAGGFAVTGPVAETDVVNWDRQLTINLRTAFLVGRRAIPLLRTDKGSMVFFSSESALTGAKVSSVSAYAVAKAGMVTLATAISQEERDRGVRVNVLAPAAIRTAANEAAMPPGTRYVERADIAATVSWLCSKEAVAVTGQVIRMTPR
jgi:3-oxoacyl-[acyl-carrier protein] reductase